VSQSQLNGPGEATTANKPCNCAICNGVADPNNMHLLYMYYLANCGHSRSNGVGISRGNNKKLGWWRGCHLTNTSHPHASYHAKFDRCCSHDLTSVDMESATKLGPSCLALQGNSKSLEPTRIDQVTMTSH